MTIISNLHQSNNSLEVDILNAGLDLSMEFGEYWLQPIQDRLKNKYSDLTIEQLNNYDSVCRQTREKSCDFVYKTLATLCNNGDTIQQEELKKVFNSFISDQYSWISEENAGRLFSQSVYYAYKDGLDKCIK